MSMKLKSIEDKAILAKLLNVEQKKSHRKIKRQHMQNVCLLK